MTLSYKTKCLLVTSLLMKGLGLSFDILEIDRKKSSTCVLTKAYFLYHRGMLHSTEHAQKKNINIAIL